MDAHDDVRSPAGPERLLEDSWDDRADAATRRELTAELALGVGFVVVAILLVLVEGDQRAFDGWLATAFVVAYAVVSRVEFPVGAGIAVPSQIVLVPMLFALPPATVPLLVAAGLVLGAAADWVLGRGTPHRILFSLPDSWHAVGPAVVLMLAGAPPADFTGGAILVGALLAQWACDIAAATGREWLGQGIAPALQLRVLATICAVDAMLAPVGLLAAHAAMTGRAAWLLALPPAALLAVLARDRSARIDQAHRRLQLVRHERSRLQVAVRRIGEALASDLDFDAVTDITLRTSIDAVAAAGGRTSHVPGDRPHPHPGTAAGRRQHHPRTAVGEIAGLEATLVAAELAALREGRGAEVREGDATAVALVVGAFDADGATPCGLLSLVRVGEPFRDDERALLFDLADQATVAASTIARHAALHRRALTDELTGLANHRRFNEVLIEHAGRHTTHSVPLSLVLLDIDNFKNVNDTYGHQVGDLVIQSVARSMRAACRETDEPARYGGEEFAVALPRGDPAAALRTAERIRQQIGRRSSACRAAGCCASPPRWGWRRSAWTRMTPPG